MMRAWMMAALLAGVLPGALTAQDTRDTEVRTEVQCRCVDADGNEIENCRCLRVPRAPMAMSVVGMNARRARIGVWIDGGQEEGLQGVRLQEVQEDGPAWVAGLRAGDVVTRVDGRSVLDPLPDAEDREEVMAMDGAAPVARFRRIVGELEPGEAVEIEALRNGRARTFTVTPESGGAVGLRGAAPFMVLEGDELRVDREELERFERQAREMAEEMTRRREEMGLDEEEMREFEQEMREHAEEMRGLERQLESRVFRFRGPEGGEAVWRFDGPEGREGRSAFSFFGGDPCVRLLERGEGGPGAVRFLGDGCVDGVEFVDLNPELASYFDAPETGVLVTEVAEEATLGLRAGDVLLALDGREVTSADHARRILRSYQEDEEVRLRVIREGSEMEVLGRRRGG